MTFQFKQISAKPVLDLSPHHARMTSCYRDLNGIWHLFVDVIDASQATQASWAAEIWYFTSKNFYQWEFVSVVIAQGKNAENGREMDADGAASPGVLPLTGKILLFYAGRRVFPAGAKMCPKCAPNQPGYVSSQIMLTQAPADQNGAPIGAFAKFGEALACGNDWDSARIDDPCAVMKNDKIHLFFKGFQIFDTWDASNTKVGYARSGIKHPDFQKRAEPIFSVPGGGEMPRVFLYQNEWHLFYRFFNPGLTNGWLWQHFKSTDGCKWKRINRHLFKGVTPGRGAADMAPVVGPEGVLADPPLALATGEADGILKIWAYEMQTRHPSEKWAT